MARLTSTADFKEDLFLPENGMPASGGQPSVTPLQGVFNIPTQELLGSTLWLREQLLARYTNAQIDQLLSGSLGALTAAEILRRLKTVDGTASGLDADLLEGAHASAFLRIAELLVRIKAVDGPGSGLDADLLDGAHASAFLRIAELLVEMKKVDGTGSGLDADLLDGLHASDFLRLSELLTRLRAVDGSGSGLDADLLDGAHASVFLRTSALPTEMKAVDGSGSGLDADLLDGRHASTYVQKRYESGQVAWANGGSYSFNHGLGARPEFCLAELVCLTSDLGIPVGDRVQAGSSIVNGEGAILISDATAVRWRVGSGGIVFDDGSLTPSRWPVIIKAYL